MDNKIILTSNELVGNELLTVKEMAAKIKTPVSWLYSRTRETGDGAIPRIKIGKYLRFNEREVMAWIKEKYANVAQ